MKVPASSVSVNPCEGERRSINPELWHACAGPLVSLPSVGSLVVYFPQGHSEQVAASMQKESDGHIPNYPNLPSKLICLLHNVTLHADVETDEVYAQMTLQPVSPYDKEALLASDLVLKSNKPHTEFFCKTLTASDTSTHGGFSVPRRAAEKIFPPLDFTMQPPAQELMARDLHDSEWTFRHIYRGQPKRHLLTTGWSLFVSGKRLFAGDSVLFIRDEKGQLLLGIRRANRQPTNISSSVLSSDSMHIGILAAAAHAAANLSPFTVFYNPRASPSEFVIPLAKYNAAVYSNQISLGMRFRMMFETEESTTRRYMGTITGISDLDPIRWKNSQWRNLQVGWDESATGERRNRVSIWEIEPVAAPFFICPPPFFRSKRPRQPGMPDDDSDIENLFKRTMPWFGDDICMKETQNSLIPGLSLAQWMSMQQNLPPLTNPTIQPDYLRSLTAPVLQTLATTDLSRQLGLQAHLLQQANPQFNSLRPNQQGQQADQLQKPPTMLDQSLNNSQIQNLVNQSLNNNQIQSQLQQPQTLVQNQTQQQNSPIQAHQRLQANLPHNQQHQQSLGQTQQKNRIQQAGNFHQQGNQPLPQSEYQIQLLLQKIQQQQQQSFLPQAITLKQSNQTQLQEQQRQLLAEAQRQLSNSHLFSQQHLIQQQQQIPKNTQLGPQFSHLVQHQPQQKLLQQATMLPELPGLVVPAPPSSNLLSTHGNCLMAAGANSVITDDAPSCSTSPSANNCSILQQSILTRSSHSTGLADGVGPPSASAGPNSTREFQKPDVKPSMSAFKTQSQVAPQTYQNPAQMDYLDTSSATSVCLSQPDGQLQQNFLLSANVNPSTILYRDTALGGEIPATDARNGVLFGVNIENSLGIPLTPEPPMFSRSIGSVKDFQNILSPGDMLAGYGNPKDIQPELSSSIVSQSLEVPDMEFNQGVSIDSAMNDGNFLIGGSWTPPQFQRKRTFTKVYKRGAVGRSIDITGYKGYEELRQDLALKFGIEGQLEDGQRIGWKLVYVDHVKDVLLVGDDPWDEFVDCVRCIRILSPTEVQRMGMDGDLVNDVLQNQACSSSDGGNAWRSGQCDQNSGNPSSGSYDH